MDTIVDRRPQYKKLAENLEKELVGNTKRIRVKKKTISNLWRYDGREETDSREVDLSAFDQPLYLDPQEKTLEVSGLTTYETIVNFTLPLGFLPTITPELKHITIGGATVGIGIESNCHRYGFVHDGVLEADVLLPNGTIVTVTPKNEYADLFHALPNSYGTLGYILRAKIRLYEAKPYVRLETKHFTSVKPFIDAMEKASHDQSVEYVETLAYTKDDLHLTLGTLTDEPENLISIYDVTPYYKQTGLHSVVSLPTKEYMFRFDPELFWNIPENWFYNLFRRIAPRSFRNSAFYNRYTALRARLLNMLGQDPEDRTKEKLIQDWEVPWEHAAALLTFALEHVDLDGKPWIATSIKTPGNATCYPLKRDMLYFNLGFYGFVSKKSGQEPYHETKIMDEFTFAHEGVKMLYSSTFVSEEAFGRIFGGEDCNRVKDKYDPNHLAPTLYEKTVKVV